MAVHWVGCKLTKPHGTSTCRDESMNILGSTEDCKEGCSLGEHNTGMVCFPRIETSRMDVIIPGKPPRRPQPTTGGPYHATVRGPGGFDVNLSGDGELFGRVLGVIGDAISSFLGD